MNTLTVVGSCMMDRVITQFGHWVGGPVTERERINCHHNFTRQDAIERFDFQIVRRIGNMVNVRASNGARPAGKFAGWKQGAQILSHRLLPTTELIEGIGDNRRVEMLFGKKGKLEVSRFQSGKPVS